MNDEIITCHIQATLKKMLPKALEQLRQLEKEPCGPDEQAMFEIGQSVEVGNSLKNCTVSITIRGASTTWSEGGI